MFKAFTLALIAHLRNKRHNFEHVHFEGGCDTCGYGGTEVPGVDMDELEREIREFSETFRRKKQ